MPTFEDIPVTIEFEVYCSECNKGLCNYTDVYTNKHIPIIKVGLCPDCMEKLKNDYETEINELKNDYETEINELKNQLEELHKELDYYLNGL